MTTIAGMQTTGRQLRGPASDLIELEGGNGLRHTAVSFHPQYRSHNGINDALTVVQGFLETPLVTGLMELVAQDRDHGAFIYPTGQVWSVAETIRLLADNGQTAGIRAGLELMYGCAQVLIEAADAGEREGVYSHGGLTPWRVMLRRDGQVLLIGYALPQVEILQFREDPSALPREDSFRYCPPERMRAEPEDLSSDLFGLALIAFELITGKPVYDGLVNDIRQQAARGEGSRRLYRFRDALPDEVGRLLARAMKPEAQDRFGSGEELLDAIVHCLHSPAAQGPSLMELMERVSSMVPRTGAKVEEAGTMVGTRDQFRAMLEQEDDTGAVEPDQPVRSRFTPAPPRRAPEPAPAPAPAPRSRSPRRSTVDEALAGLRKSGVRRAPRRRSPAPETLAEPSSQPLPAPAPTPAAAPASGRYAAVSPRRGPRRPNRSTPEAMPAPTPTAAPTKPGAVTPDMLAPMGRPTRKTGPRRARRGSPPAPAPAPGESLHDSSSTSTNDLLARIRASASIPRRPRRTARPGSDEVAGPPETKLEELLRTSGAGAKAKKPVESPAPAPPRVDLEGPTQSSRAGGGAPKLSEADTARRPPSLPERPTPTPPTPPVSTVRPPVESSPPKLLGDEPAPAPAPAPKEPQERESTDAQLTPRSTAPAQPGSLDRNPDAIPSGAGKGGSASFTIRRGPGGRTTRMRLPLGATAAEAVSWLVGNLVPVRTTLTGAIAGWYRFHQGGKAVPPGSALDALDREQELTLTHVHNRTVFAQITVEHGTQTHSLLSPVGTAVPFASLTDHLCAWLALPSGRWRLRMGDVMLDPHGILEDFPEALGSGTPVALRLAAETTARSSRTP